MPNTKDWQKQRGGRIDPLRSPSDDGPMTTDERIDEAIAESFPASDPPSFNGGIDEEKSQVNLEEKFAAFSEHWQPRVVGELNGQHVKLVKLKGEFVWHHHENEDEMFLVTRGAITIQLRDRDVHIHEGEFFIVPRGVEHRPIAAEEAHVMLFEPASTVNTGNVRNERTYIPSL